MYFVTICTHKRQKILSEIGLQQCRGRVPPLPIYNVRPNTNNSIKPDLIPIVKNTKIGNYIENSIRYINKIENVKIQCYVIMPDHVHMIVELYDIEISANKGRGRTLPLHRIIGQFKSYTTKQFNILNETVGIKLWQRNFYERIIRNEQEYFRTCEYIKNNPINDWEKYKFL